jgi:hypothetical protein
MLGCLYSRHLKLILNHKEGHMQSTNSKGIKAALWEQAFIGGTQVSCPMGQVGAIRKGQLLAMIRECGRWYLVEYVTIEVMFTWPCSHERVAA